MCRKFNTCDSLLCVNVRICDIVVCPFSTIFTTQMDWWQLIDFDNTDNEFRVVRNLYHSVSVSRITLRWKRYTQEALKMVASLVTTAVVTRNGEIRGVTPPHLLHFYGI